MRTKTGVLQEILARQTIQAFNKIELKGDFPEQDAFVADPARYIANQCSRRAGKTNGLAIKFIKTMEKHPKSQSVYLGLTRESAREVMWPVMQEFNDRYALGMTFIESKLTVVHPNGARLVMYGADMKNFIKRLRGRKYPGVAIDEAQDLTTIETLINDVLTPSIADYPDGWIALTGTPGPVPNGYFFEVTQNKRYGYSHHGWTLLQNPHMPDPEAFLKDLLSKREWDRSNPTFRREYLNQWVLDVQSLWVQYNEKACDFDELPAGHVWSYIMGVDIGFRDADAIAIVAWSETCPNTYLIDELITNKQGITELVEQMNQMHKKYKNIHKVVMDEGGLGKKVAEEIRVRHGIAVEPADKLRKQENVELLNDSMRLGKFKAKKGTRFALDSYLVQIDWEKSTPNKIIIKKTPHSDIIDAVLYAFKESYAYSHAPPPPPKPKWGTQEWSKEQEEEMFERERELLLQQQQYDRWASGEGDY